MEIVNLTQQVLREHRRDWVPRWAGYARTLTENRERILAARSTFNEWAPLRNYLPIGKALTAKNRCRFSVRYMGKDVAELEADGASEPLLVLSEGNHSARNREMFRVDLRPGRYAWTGAEAAAFRKHFIAYQQEHGQEEEHVLESMILDEMQTKDESKFAGQLRCIQPVRMYDKLRFQMKVPLSANTGEPKHSTSGGGIDILARIGTGADTHLGVIELKRDEASAYKSAAGQGLIYSVCVLNLLRDPCMGVLWWRLFGYNRRLPEALKTYSIAMVPQSLASKYTQEMTSLGLYPGSAIEIGSDVIKCGHIFFEVVEDDGRQCIRVTDSAF